MERIPGFGSNMQLHGATDPAALSALVRDIVCPIIKDVIGPIATQLDEMLRWLDDIEADASANAWSSVTDIVGKAVKEASVPMKDKFDIVLNKLSVVGVKMQASSLNVANSVPAYLMQMNADTEYPAVKPPTQPTPLYFSSTGSSWASAAAQRMTTSQPAVNSAAKCGIKTSMRNIKSVPRLLTAFVGHPDNCTTVILRSSNY